MKIGVTQIILSSLSLEEIVQLCDEAGYQALELVFREGGEPDISMSDDEIKKIRKRFEEVGVEISSSIAWYADRGNLLSLNSKEQKSAERSLIRSLEIAEVLGVDAVLLHPGQLTSDGTYQNVWDRMIRIMKEVALVAEKKRVIVGIENVWNKFLLTSREMGQFLDSVDSEAVAAYLDTANMMAYGFPEHWIRDLGSRIVRIHFKDFDRNAGHFVPLLDGDTDWLVVMKELHAIGYNSPVIHEVGGDWNAQIEMAKRMRQILKRK